VVDRGVPAVTGTTATGYHAVVVRLVSDSGNITGVDASTGPNGFTGHMLQRWTSSGGDGTYDTSTPGFSFQQNLSSSPVNFDSHFLNHQPNPNDPLDGFAAVSVNPVETLGGATLGPSGPNPPFPNNTDSAAIGVAGANAVLKTSYGIKGFRQASTFDIAYIVATDQTLGFGPGAEQGPIMFQGQVATAGGTFLIPPTPIVIPEPATLSLAGLAGLGVLARRRRD
jgi:hypothetical protein